VLEATGILIVRSEESRTIVEEKRHHDTRDGAEHEIAGEGFSTQKVSSRHSAHGTEDEAHHHRKTRGQDPREHHLLEGRWSIVELEESTQQMCS
jgi:hypothetical protein